MLAKRKKNITIPEYLEGLSKGEKRVLSKAITLVESNKNEDKILASQLLDQITKTEQKSLRIGITGIPGVGKSTFIESLGKVLLRENFKVAILSIDPSSALSKGSILGDKTRMPTLSKNENAFIRPSPTNNTLGGVGQATRETISLCEAAGYPIILVETVGVGQSETVVKEMVDFFLLLLMPGSGDELQGMKRGIMEMADGIFVNKADVNPEKAQQTLMDFKNALHLFAQHENDWISPVVKGAASNGEGIKDIWEIIIKYKEKTLKNGFFMRNRILQQKLWFHKEIGNLLQEKFYANHINQKNMKVFENKIQKGEISVRNAINTLFKNQ